MNRLRMIDLRLIILSGLALLILTALLLLSFNYRSSCRDMENSIINSVTDEFEIITGVYADMADSIYHLHINTPEILEIF